MARYYSDEEIKILEDERTHLRQRLMQLQKCFMGHQLRNRQADDFAKYGFGRRLLTIVRCIENTFAAIPPEFDGVPTLYDTQDVMIQVQAFIFNVFGCLDNLAWIWVLERNVTKPDGEPLPPQWIGLQPKNTCVRQSLGQGLQEFLKSMDTWFANLEEFRHALAHQIPLYVLPFAVAPSDAERFSNLERFILASLVRRNKEELEAHTRERDSLRFFRPWIVGSSNGQQKIIAFHFQMLTDFKTIERIGAELFGELGGQPT
jgi:hypothetical protein